MTGNEAISAAIEAFDGGFNCAEAVFLAGCAYGGVDSELVPKVATAFGGGLSRTKLVCGALTGAAMALSAVYGRNKASDDRIVLMSKVQELVAWFRGEFGCDGCYELTGLDFNTPEGQQKYKEHTHIEVCESLVSKTMAKLLELL